jgi:hypothetical protein
VDVNDLAVVLLVMIKARILGLSVPSLDPAKITPEWLREAQETLSMDVKQGTLR